MNKLVFYHGTSFENADSIFRNGFSMEAPRIWKVSESRYVYAYMSNPYPTNNEFGYDDRLHAAVESAVITAAVQRSRNNIIVVFKIDIPENVWEEMLHDGYANEDLSERSPEGAYQIDAQKLTQLIREKKIFNKPIFLDDVYDPDMRYQYLEGVDTQFLADDELAKTLEALKYGFYEYSCEKIIAAVENKLQAKAAV